MSLWRNFARSPNSKDVARLVLYLKELIPDYNPGSPLLKLALSAATAQAPIGEAESPRSGHHRVAAAPWNAGQPAELKTLFASGVSCF